MKLKQLITPFAAALYVFAAGNLYASSTNIFTFKATVFPQGAQQTVSNITTSAAAKSISVATADIISALGTDTTNTFSKSAKLELIGHGFAVVDGANIVDVSSFIALSFGTNDIESGKFDNNTEIALPTLKDSEIVTLTFSDATTKFYLTGLAVATTTDSTPKNGVYTETFKATVSSMTGEGVRNGIPFVATGTLSGSGKSVFPAP
jgi:hypothetical protein